MRKQLICFIFLFFVCLLMPSMAMADFDLDLSTPDYPPYKINPGASIILIFEVLEDGSPVSGQSVTFSVSPDDGLASVSPTSETTDSNGQAETTLSLTGDSSEPHYEVTAKLDDDQSITTWVPVGTVSDGAELKLYINDARPYNPGESVGFTFSLRKDGKGVSGRTVTFSLSPDDGTASLSTTSATTDSNGSAGTKVVLGSDASGSYTVTATLDDGKSVSNSTGSVHNPTLQPPDFTLSMTISSGAIPLSPGESRTFIAIAQKDGKRVSGKTVTFSVSPNDGTVSLSTTSATTDSNGEASTSLITGSGSSGSYTVTASGGPQISISGTVTVETSSSSPPVEVSPPEVISTPISESNSNLESSTQSVSPHENSTGQPNPQPPVQPNNPPVFSDGTSTTRSVAENTPANTNIGAPIAATDSDTGDTLTYTLSGTDAASFSIDSRTGQLQTVAALDYETKNAYSVTITVTDQSGLKTDIDVTINVTDVNETVTPPHVQQPQPNSQPQPNPQPQSQPESQPQPDPQPSQPQPDPQPQPEIDPESEPQPKAEIVPIPEPEPEPNYTIIPFDYEKEAVGTVVFSELMLARLNKYPQWIELYNTTNQDIDVKGWKIVGRYLDDSNTINILESQVISKSLIIKSKETVLIVSYATPNSRDRISKDLADKTYDLESNSKNSWNYEGIVLELQDTEGNPIDRMGNLNEKNEIVWEIPVVVRDKRISLMRRLKSIRSQEYNFTFGIKEFGWFPANENERLAKGRSPYYYGRYTDTGSPGYRTEGGELLPVTLSSFNPRLNQDGSVVISWRTESEIDNAGFHVLRSEKPQGPFIKVNPKLIQGAGTTGERNEYMWADVTAKPNTAYYYRIEDVSFSGVKQTLATKRMKGIFTVKNRLLTHWGDLKTRL